MAKTPKLIMGTSGHVDHGKTSLVKALTGVDLDTLPEEKARGVTINLGFTSFDTPSGVTIGIVDVPGHKRFVKNMLSGAHGIDFVLFLVASDDSIMPQTIEHLEILKLLGVDRGIVVLTKIDLVDDDLLELAKAEVEDLVAGTFLEHCPLVKVSSLTGQGMPDLINELDAMAARIRPREKGSYFRMFVDRSFTVAGAGTVVTGTTLSGSVSPGDEVEILPSGGSARIRRIQVHGEQVEKTRAGQRTAINLRTIDKALAEKGDMLVSPGMAKPTYMVDVKLKVLPEYPKPLPHWTRVRFYIGSHEAFGRVVLLDVDQAEPDSEYFAQIRLEAPAPAVTGDPYIVRDFSSSWTIGGGRVLDAHPTKHKRKRHLVVCDLERREAGYLEEVVELEAMKAGYFVRRNQIAADLDAPVDQVGQAAAKLDKNEAVVVLPPKKSPWMIHADAWKRMTSRLAVILGGHHETLPQLATGLSEQELRDRLAKDTGADLPEEAFRHGLERMVATGLLRQVEGTYALSEHSAALGKDDEIALAGIRALYSDNLFAPPATDDLYAGSSLPKKVVRDFIERLVAEGELVRVSREYLFERRALDQALAKVREHLASKGTMTVAEFRDLVGTSRKYALPLLNYFDNQGHTVRDGDHRSAGPGMEKP